MSKIELIPEGSGRPITCDTDAPLVYLLGHGGGFRWTTRMDSDAIPILVATATHLGVAFAPLHPMCHLGGDAGAVSQKKSGDVIQIGVSSMTIRLNRSGRFIASKRRFLIVCGVAFLFVVTGWFLHGLVKPSSPVAASELEEPYVF